jgi:ribosomal protein L29
MPIGETYRFQGLLIALLAEWMGVRVQQDWRQLNQTLLFKMYCRIISIKIQKKYFKKRFQMSIRTPPTGTITSYQRRNKQKNIYTDSVRLFCHNCILYVSILPHRCLFFNNLLKSVKCEWQLTFAIKLYPV